MKSAAQLIEVDVIRRAALRGLVAMAIALHAAVVWSEPSTPAANPPPQTKPQSAGTPVLSLLFVPPYVIAPAEKDAAVIPLPVTVNESREAADVCIERVGVRFQNKLDGQVAARFDVPKKLAMEPNSVPVLLITIKDVSKLLPGDYLMLLRVLDCAVPPAKRAAPETLSITFSRPAIKLDPPGKLTIDRRLTAPWKEHATVSPASFRLFTQDAATFRAPVEASMSPFRSGPGAVNVGDWSDSKVTHALNGAGLDVALAPKAFPIGVASGMVTFRGVELAAPLHVDVDVRTRLDARWIAWMILVGVLAGWLLRTVLQRRVELAQAREPALEQLASWAEELRKIPDETFAKTLREQMEPVRLAVIGKDAAKIPTAVAAANTAMGTARTDLNKRITDETKKVDDLRTALDVQAPLPTKLADLRRAVTEELAGCATLLGQSNPTEASKQRAAIERRLQERFSDALVAIARQIESMADDTGRFAPLLDDAQRPRLQEKLQALTAAGKQATAAPAATADVGAVLTRVAQLGREWQAALEWSANAIDVGVESLDKAAAKRIAPGTSLEQERDALKTASRELQQQLIKPGSDGWAPAVWRQAADVARESAVALVRALPAQNPKLQEAARRTFDEALSKGSLHAACEALPTLDETLHQRVGAKDEVPDVNAEDGIARQEHRSTASLLPDLSPLTIEKAQARNRTAFIGSALLLSVILAVLLAWASVAAFEEKFIGGWGELLGLFFWGFSADLGTDKLIEKVRGLGLLPKTGGN